MKRLLLVALLMANALLSMAADITMIAVAFQKGDAAAMQSAMAQSVDVAISDKNKNCNTQEAVAMLAEFFKSHKPEACQVVHHADKGERGFFVAKLKSGGQQYRVNVAYKAENDKAIIQSIRIE